MLPQSYRFLKIDRAAVRTHTGSSHAARQAMGEVPADILSGERQAPLVPRKMKFPTGIAGQVGLHSEPAAPHRNTLTPKTTRITKRTKTTTASVSGFRWSAIPSLPIILIPVSGDEATARWLSRHPGIG